MKRTVMTALVGALALSSCGTLSPSVAQVNAGPVFGAQGIDSGTTLLTGGVWCPPDATHSQSWPCGTFRIQRSGGPGMGGNIVPSDLLLQGEKALYAGLGNQIQTQLPGSRYTKFQVGKVLFTVESMDKSLYNASAGFSFMDSSQIKGGLYQFVYSGQLLLNY